MSETNKFFCHCGEMIHRPKDERQRSGAWAMLPWHAEQGEPLYRGIRCNCRQWWSWLPKVKGPFVEVWPCCKVNHCKCKWEITGNALQEEE